MSALGAFVCGWRLWDRFMEGNLIGSRMKKTGVLLKTESWFPFFGIEFHGVSSYISYDVWKAFLSSKSGYSQHARSLLSNAIQECCRSQVWDVMSNFKTAESASGLGMNYSAICLVAASENFKGTHLSGILPWAKCARVSINCVSCNTQTKSVRMSLDQQVEHLWLVNIKKWQWLIVITG